MRSLLAILFSFVLAQLLMFGIWLVLKDIMVTKHIREMEASKKLQYAEYRMDWYKQAYQQGVEDGWKRGYNDRILYELKNKVILLDKVD